MKKPPFYKKFLIILILCFIPISHFSVKWVSALPFYDLQPRPITLRAKFYTSYPSSSEERKHNIYLASKSIDGVMVDSNCEFSFNLTVGPRTERRGYKSAKIIFNGQFVDGVGGGVCQVSTTLYNAVLLAGLKVTEYHPHSLAVSYVAPSFDAMVNSGSADLKFINTTHNPVFIKAVADGNKLTIEIHGEKMHETYTRESIIEQEITAPDYVIKKDVKGEYPDLFIGERKILSYKKNGIASKGFLIKKVNGKTVAKLALRKDRYSSVTGVIIEGTTPPPETNENKDDDKIIEF